jgi:acyl-CoA thioesterase
MHNANAYPAYQYPNPNRSIALVSKEAIKMLEFTNRKNKNAAPEYAVWVKSRDELMNDPVLVVGQKCLLTPLSSSYPCPMMLTLYSPFISLD